MIKVHSLVMLKMKTTMPALDKKIRVLLRGGLGNQLFQYSAGLYYSQKFSLPLVLDALLLPMKKDSLRGISRWPEAISGFAHSGELRANSHQPENSTNLASKSLTVLRLISDTLGILPPTLGLYVGEKQRYLGDLRITGRQPVLLDGYFINRFFPLANASQIRKELNSIVNPSTEYLSSLADVQKMVAIHVRLGDFLTLNSNLRSDYSEYLSEALRLSRHLDQKVRDFMLFSDNEHDAFEIVKKMLPARSRLHIAPRLSSIETLNLMGSCNGLVGSASTFSWWGAFLQDGPFAVFPRNWETSSNRKRKEILLNNWLTVG